MFHKIARLFQKEKRDIKERFTEYYKKNTFRGKESISGEGSSMLQTQTIREKLPEFFEKYNVKKIIDAPCGDFHWMKEVNLPGIEYLGLDIVEELVEKNNSLYKNQYRNFSCKNLVDDIIPMGDIIICRDCLVHLNFEQAFAVLENFKKSGTKYLLTTTYTDRKSNADLVIKEIWRPLNLQKAPFNLPQPVELINENSSEGRNKFRDKCLGLWLLNDIIISCEKDTPDK